MLSSSDSDSSPPQITLEERLNQLHHSLSLINAERENLYASLKQARKESQKADAALRSEMDTLKRASEKHSAGEARTRQKILALQEAVKRAQAATKETESLVESVEEEVPDLLQQKKDKEAEYTKVKQEADRVRKTRETSVEKDRKREESMRSELQSLTHKLEKLTAKKEKHGTTTIPDLEQQLSALRNDIEAQEKLWVQMEMNREFEDVNRLVLTSVGQQQQQQALGATVLSPFNLSPHYPYGEQPTYVPVQRTRHSSLGTTPGSGPGLIGRPSHVSVPVAPIQRPTFSSSSSSSSILHSGSGSGVTNNAQNIWSPPQIRNTPNNSNVAVGRSGSVHYHPQHSQQYREASFYPPASNLTSYQQQDSLLPISPPTILANPSRRGSLKSGSFGKAPASPIPPNSSSSSTPAPNTTASSTTNSSDRRRSSLSSVSPPKLQVITSPTLQQTKGAFAAPTSPSNMNSSTSMSSALSSRAPVFEPGKARGPGPGPIGSGTSRAPGGGTSRGPGVIGAGRRS